METQLSISGMTCGHCVASVTEELSAVEGVKDVRVDLVDPASGTRFMALNEIEIYHDDGTVPAPETFTLLKDDGTVITFDGAAEFANYQVSHDPFQVWVLISTVTMLVALVGSLTIKRRRIFLRQPLSFYIPILFL